MSALIRKSTIRNIILTSFFEFYFPETAFHKILKYKKYIIEKAKMSDEEFLILIIRLFSRITLISKKNLIEYREQARRIMSLIDDEDTIFIASALYLGSDAVIWTDDADFDKQNQIATWKTYNIIQKFQELPE